MKESVGYTVTLNIMIVFITIVIAFLCVALVYFKSNKVSNVITSAIEKYEGFNDLAINEINSNLTSLGYGSHIIRCAGSVSDEGDENNNCTLVTNQNGSTKYGQGESGYCVYYCEYTRDDDGDGNYDYYYYYKIRTNMMFNIPIIHDILDIPIYSNTNGLYDFEK